MAWGATEELHLRGAAPSAPCSPRARPGTESPPAHPHNPDIGAPWSRRPAGRLRPARSRGQEEKRVRPRESNERQTAPRLRGLGTKGQQATTAGRDRHRSTPVEYTPSQRRGMWAPEYSCPSRPSFQGRFGRSSSWRASEGLGTNIRWAEATYRRIGHVSEGVQRIDVSERLLSRPESLVSKPISTLSWLKLERNIF